MSVQLKQEHLTITRPDDWHLHLRDGEALAAVLPDTARQFARAIVMPSPEPPVTTVALARAYRNCILAALPRGARFEPLMTLYLTETGAGTSGRTRTVAHGRWWGRGTLGIDSGA